MAGSSHALRRSVRRLERQAQVALRPRNAADTSISLSVPMNNTYRSSYLAPTLMSLALAVAVSAQQPFVDDAGRTVSLRPATTRVFAAGAPAEVLLYTLAPDLLVGRNRLPSKEALDFFPSKYRAPVLIRRLPEVDDPDADAELLSLRSDLYVDYGTVDRDYTAVVEAVQRRTGVPGIILDGTLSKVPDAYRRLGAAVGREERGRLLGAAAERLLMKYRGALSAGGRAPRVYIACSGDVLTPCYADERSGEGLQWLGGINVAGYTVNGLRPALTIEQISALKPDVVVVSSGASRALDDPRWKQLAAVTQGQVYQWPELPFGWGARPPSVNRLPGLVWLAHVGVRRSLGDEFEQDVRSFFADFYHLELTAAQMQRLRSPQ